ncbi:MAG: PilZ domain-containing protein [Oligoflexales bacterium]
MKEKRKYKRLALEDISARLFYDDDKSEVDFCPINVSKQGFSIFVTRHFSEGSQLTLELSVKNVPLVVRWCRAKEDDPAVFRCGLETKDSDEQLDELIKNELSY